MTSDDDTLAARLLGAQAAVSALARKDVAAAVIPLDVVVTEPGARDDVRSLALVYGRLRSSVKAVLGDDDDTLHARRSFVRLLCPACGTGFLEADLVGFKKLTLTGTCVHCDATLPELQRHLQSRTYPKDAREVPPEGRLPRLEEELEHVRHLAGLEHPTTVTWERLVAEEALLHGLVERARGLLTRATRSVRAFGEDAMGAQSHLEVFQGLAALLVAEGSLVEGERLLTSLGAQAGVGDQHLLATVRAALGRRGDACRALTALASSCGWPADVVERQLAGL